MHKIIIFLSIGFVLFSCKKDIVIYDSESNDEFELATILKLDNKNCAFDAATKTLRYSIAKTDLDNYTPSIEFQSYSRITFEGKQLVNGQLNELGDLELHKKYVLSIETLDQIETLFIVFTDIPIVQLVLKDEIPNEPKALGKITVYYPSKTKVSESNWMGIERRGASSSFYDKKSYGLTICNGKSTKSPLSKSFFGLQENEDWILDAMYIDKAKCRNKISFELWESMDGNSTSHLSIHSNFVEVFLNNESRGLYCFNENFTRQTLNSGSNAVFYRGIDNSEVSSFHQLATESTTRSEWGQWEQRIPKPSTQIIWSDFKELSKTIVESDDAYFSQNIGNQIDLDNVIDYYLFINVCQGYDNLGKNWSFLKRDNNEKFIIVPWDLDATWGRNAVGEAYNSSALLTNGLFERLVQLNPNNFNLRVKYRWAELRNDQFSEVNLNKLVDHNINELISYQIIPIENGKWNQNNNLELEKLHISSILTDRLQFMDGKFQ